MIFDIAMLECLNLNILLVVFTDGSCLLSVIFIASNAINEDENSYYLESARDIEGYQGSCTF